MPTTELKSLSKKDLHVEDIIRSIINLKKHKLKAHYNWIIGFPAETNEDRIMTLNMIKFIRKIYPVIMHKLRIYSPYPNTELFDKAVEKGYKIPGTLEEWRTICTIRYATSLISIMRNSCG